MPKPVKAKTPQSGKLKRSEGTRKRRSARNQPGSTSGRTQKRGQQEFPSLVQGGRTTHVLVPVEEYERLLVADMVQTALARRNDPDHEFVDADDFGVELAAQTIAEARKAAGLTQKQLGEKIGVPQSQVSRIERRPDRTTVRTLRRMAKALKVDVGVFLKGL